MSTSSVTAAIAELLTIPDRDVSQSLSREEAPLRALLAAAQAGDREAFGELVTLFQRVVFRTTLAALGTREDAEDATQEAFVVLWQKLQGFRGESSFRTWLLTIAWRKALDRRRARKLWWARTQPPRPADTCDPLDVVPEAAANPEERALTRDLAVRIRAEIQRLSPKLRDTLLLAATGEYSYQEIAEMQTIPVGTVKWRVSEARKAIAAALDRASRGLQ